MIFNFFYYSISKYFHTNYVKKIDKMEVQAYAVKKPKGKLEKYTYTLPSVGAEEVDIKVHYLWYLSLRFKYDEQ